MWADWKEVLTNRKFVIHFILALAGLVAFALFLPYFFNEILLPKPGMMLTDPVLMFFRPRDWSIEIFILIYACTVLSLAFNFTNPNTILLGLQVYVVVNFGRILSLYLFTLEAPVETIPLSDPFLTVFAYGKSVYVKDLFFSGHISTLFLLFVIEQRRLLKVIFLISTIIVAVFLAWQRVHYTLDIIAAPLVTWGVFRFFTWIDQRLGLQKTN